MREKIIATISEHNLIKSGEKIVVAISGGPDSVCLLHVLQSVSKQLNFKIYAVHINHMLRGKESDHDEKYTLQLCSELGIEAYSFSHDIAEISKAQGMSLEEAGREIRYKELNDFAEKHGITKIAVAHNKNDQAETVLMHIIRGSGLKGLTGMEYISGKIIRPLLDIERSEIEKYCESNSLKPRTDSSNLTTDYTRNKIRIELIPHINKQYNVDLTENICRMAHLTSFDNDFIEKCANHAYEACVESSAKEFISLKLDMLKQYHPSILRNVLRKSIFDAFGSIKGIENIHIEDLVKLIGKSKTSSVIQLPKNIRVRISYNILEIFKEKNPSKAQAYCEVINAPGSLYLDAQHLLIKSSIEHIGDDFNNYVNKNPGSMTQFFDYDVMTKGIHIRSRRSGDIFKPLKSTGTKKLKEYFIDKKIKQEIREIIPIVAAENEVIWIVGYRISDKFKVAENTKRVLKLEVFDGKA